MSILATPSTSIRAMSIGKYTGGMCDKVYLPLTALKIQWSNNCWTRHYVLDNIQRIEEKKKLLFDRILVDPVFIQRSNQRQ